MYGGRVERQVVISLFVPEGGLFARIGRRESSGLVDNICQVLGRDCAFFLFIAVIARMAGTFNRWEFYGTHLKWRRTRLLEGLERAQIW